LHSEAAALLRVLIVSRAPRALAEIKKTLMESFDICIASTGGAALASLEAYKPDIIVICVGEDREAAFQDYRELRAKSAGIPALFLAERDNASDEAAAFAMGANDYCLKRDDGSALKKRLRLRVREGTAFARPAITALIAEDVAINRDIMSAMLGDIPGLSIDFASDGLEALEKFKSSPERYSIIFMDIHMPVMDGLAATREIRALEHEAAKSVPIIALTASAPEESAMLLCGEAGMNGKLEKPMDRERFLEVCAKYIQL
jgi:CheY-like chemotaxis protein